MRDFVLVVAGGMVAAALVLGVTHALSAPAVEAPPAITASASGSPWPGSGASGLGAAADVARIEGQLQKLTSAVTLLQQRLDAMPTRTPVIAPGDEAPVSADALVHAFELANAKQERERLAALTPGETLAAARERLYAGKDAVGARRMLESLLERSLSNADRATAMTELGIVQRTAGNLPASVTALQYALDTQGIDSDGGAHAAFQLAWTFDFMHDAPRARTLFENVARSTGVNENLRLEARWNAAKLAFAAGDSELARAEFSSLLRDCGNTENYRHIAADVQARLKGM